MKLRNLNGAIRKVEGAPTVGVMTPLGYIHVPVQKTGLLDALRGLSDDPQIETHMEVSEDGRLVVTEEGRAIIEAKSKAPSVTLEDEIAEERMIREHYPDMADPNMDDLLDDDVAREEIEDEDESLAAMTNDPFAVEDACLASSDDLDDLLG